MSLFGDVTSFLSGGRDQQSEQALNDAMKAFSAVQSPTAQQLSLPQLQQYVDAGVMTPAQAQAYLQQNNAYNQENVPQTGTQAMIEALNQLSSVANAGPNGTPQQQAQMANTIEQLNQSVQGQRGAIEQQMEARGTPAALVQAALQNQYVGQDAQQAHLDAVNGQSAAYQAALNALSQKGQVGQNLQTMQQGQANTVAQAQNAMQQFNAANQQQNSALNAQLQQQANQVNQQNKQNISNQNTQQANARTAYNTQATQQAYDDAMQRASGIAGIYGKQANNYQTMGNQTYGTALKVIGGLADAGQSAAMAGAGPSTSSYVGAAAHGAIIGDHGNCYHDGGMCMVDGGMVPGHSKVPGDSLQNDTVHAMLSPGEAVIPRTAVQSHMPEVLSLLANHQQPGQVHPHDVATMLKAMRDLRMGVA